eukprot:EG_transcript_7629
MTRWTTNSHYGSFDPGHGTSQIVEDYSTEEEVKRKVGFFCNHPLNRALMVLAVFATMGLILVISDHTTVPSQQQDKTVSRTVKGGHYGCLVEVGLTGSQLTLYQINAPWQLLEMERQDVPMDLPAVLKDGTGSELARHVQAALGRQLKDTRVLTRQSMAFGAVKVKEDAKALSPGVVRDVQLAVVTALEKNGFKQCNDWDRGGCIDRQSVLNWGMLERMDKDVQSWFAKAVTNVNSWRDAAKEHGEKVAQEARGIKERAKEELEKESKAAKKKYEQAKEAVEQATQRRRTENHGKKRSERSEEKAERQFEKELRRAEEEYESIVRKAEKEFDKLERHAEDLLQKAEKEIDEIDRKADDKLRRLQHKMDALCKTKCKPPAPPAPAAAAPAPASQPAAPAAPVPAAAPEEAPSAPLPKDKPKKDSATTAKEEEAVAPAPVAVTGIQRQSKRVAAAEPLAPKSAAVEKAVHDDIPQEVAATEADNDDEPKALQVKRKVAQRFDDELQRSYLGEFAKLTVHRK